MEYPTNQKGLTLIEVLASLTLLGLLAASFFPILTSSTTWIFRAGKSTQAINMANTILENIKANSNLIKTGTFSRNMLNISIENNGLGLSIDDEIQEWVGLEAEVIIKEIYINNGIIMETPPDMASNLLELMVNITWQEHNQDYSQELTTVISRR